MAVQPPHHLNQFPSHLFPDNRDEDIVIGHEGSMNNVYNNTTHMNYSSLLPLSGTTTTTTASDAPLLPPPLNYSFIVDQKPHPLIKAHTTTARKRSRDYSFNYLSDEDTFCFLGQDLSPHINHQQLHLDRLIAHHMESVRAELEEKRKRQARRLLEAIEVGMVKRLRAKEEEMARIGKLNWALQEKVKSLCVENQIWRDLAQTNEATANALRTNLQQVLTHHFKDDATDLTDDAHSCCCGSTGEGEDGGAKDKDKDEEGDDRGGERKGGGWMLCKKCGREESCVLMLPCRHLCLCAACASSLNSYCPLCKSFQTATLHVNLSSI